MVASFGEVVRLPSTFDPRGALWRIQGAGRILCGSEWDRVIESVAGTSWLAGIKAAYYDSPYGNYVAASGATISVTWTDTTAGLQGVPPGGSVLIFETFMRSVAGFTCRSNFGFPPPTGTDQEEGAWLFTNPSSTAWQSPTVTSTSVPMQSETFITSRIFSFDIRDNTGTSVTGGFYQAAVVPLTMPDPADPGAWTGDSTPGPVSWTTDELVQFRPLEVAGECSLFPAVGAMVFWNSTFAGGGLNSRFPAASNFNATKGSSIFTLQGTDDSSFQFWIEADYQKNVVYRGPDFTDGSGFHFKSGVILGTIRQVLTQNAAVVFVAQDYADTDGNWAADNLLLQNPNADSGADEMLIKIEAPGNNNVYITPIYIGEAADGLTYGYVTWSPFNVLQSSDVLDRAGRIVGMGLSGNDIVTVYEHGVGVIQGEPMVGIPYTRYRMVPISFECGSFNPQAMWNDGSRTLWFQGSARLWKVQGTNLIDATRQMNAAGAYRERIGEGVGDLEAQRASFSASRNSSLIVGMTARSSEDQGHLGLYLCGDRGNGGSMHPFIFYTRITACCSYPLDEMGYQANQWFLGGENRVVYELDPPAQEAYPDFYDEIVNETTGAVEHVDVLYHLDTGIKNAPDGFWRSITRTVRLLARIGSPDAQIGIQCYVSRGVNRGTDQLVVLARPYNALTTGNEEQEFTSKQEGYAFRLVLDGNSGFEQLKLLGLRLIVESTPERRTGK